MAKTHGMECFVCGHHTTEPSQIKRIINWALRLGDITIAVQALAKSTAGWVAPLGKKERSNAA
jgi:hypothetical protein